MNRGTSGTSNRIESIDALRGFALAGIVIVHMVEQYTASMIPEEWQAAKQAGLIDQIIDGSISILLRDKFFALFSLLFGLSFFIQMDNAKKRGVRFEGRFVWRLVTLFIIGVFHHMFYSGDILTIYAVIGLLIIPFFQLDDRFILGVALIFILGFARLVVYGLFGIEDIFPLSENAIKAYWEILQTGTLLEVFHINGTERMIAKASFQLGFIGRGGLTLGYFLLGLWIGKSRIIENLESERKKLKKYLVWSLSGMGVFLIITPVLFVIHGQNENLDSWFAMFGLTAADQFNIFFTFVIALSFILLFHKPGWNKYLNSLAPFGRMALTNYFLQSVIGTFILFGWGLGYVGRVSNSTMFLLAIVVILLQVVISTWWLKKFKFGPLEWLWRSAIYLKWQPLRKQT